MSDQYFHKNDPRIAELHKGHIAHAVRVLLGERLEKLGLHPERTYITSVDNLVSQQIFGSRTLFDEVLEKVQENDRPTYSKGNVGIFTESYSFAPEHKVKGLDIIQFENMLINIVDVLN